MMKKWFCMIGLSLLLVSCANQQSKPLATAASGKHLFILSGQSNMVGLNVENFFTPLVNASLGADNTVIVKDAKGAQPIRRWYKNWQPSPNNIPPKYDAQKNGILYKRLLFKVNAAIKNETIESVTFIWMQGERDAREKQAHLYQESFLGLVEQLKNDLNHNNINVVIGRLSDFDLTNSRYPHWSSIREIQVALPQALSNAAWVNTDDLNDGVNKQGKAIDNDLHYSVAGYKFFGQRLAESALLLLNKP